MKVNSTARGNRQVCCPQLQGLSEHTCVLKWSGQPIGIGPMQRYVAHWERKNKQPPPALEADTRKNVAIIGAGPSAIAGADLLRRYDHHVIIYEALPSPGRTA
ncbi:MAG: NAD(P)-binding protein [Thermoproteota archaeon]|nr:NAD(P)-binding protein [Thermoproteota archaeon]